MRLVINLTCPVASKIIASAILLFRNATTENQSVNRTTVNCPRGGDKKQCQIPTWGVGMPRGGGMGHEIDKCITSQVYAEPTFMRVENKYSYTNWLSKCIAPS